MKEFKISPHVGVGPIKLGMTRAEVETCFGKPEFQAHGRVGYFSGFMIDYDEDGRVEFIELAKSNEFEVSYKDVNLHVISASEAVALVEKDDVHDKDDPEVGHSYIFKNLQLSLWRGTVSDNGQDEDGKYIEAIGIAINGYF